MSVSYEVESDRFMVEGEPDAELFRPLSFCYEITNACHFSCDFCIVSDHRKQPKQEVSESIISALTSEGPVRIGFSGGEPLLIPYVYDLAAMARERRSITLLRTTGTRTVDTQKCLESFHWVDISMDGANEQTYTQMRGRPGFGTACTTIRELTRAGLRVRLNSLLSEVNRPQLIDIVKLASDLKVRQLRFLPLVHRGGAAKDEVSGRHALSLSALEDQVNLITEVASAYPSLNISILQTTKEEALFIVKPNGELFYPSGSLLVPLGNVLNSSLLQLIPKRLLERHCRNYFKHNEPLLSKN